MAGGPNLHGKPPQPAGRDPFDRASLAAEVALLVETYVGSEDPILLERFAAEVSDWAREETCPPRVRLWADASRLRAQAAST